MTDSQILIKSFNQAKERANPEELVEITRHLEFLRLDPTDPQILNMCAEFYARIHHLLTFHETNTPPQT